MEAPGLIASAAKNLINGDVQLGLKPHHKEWVVTAWLDELCTYMNQPDANIAYERLRWLPMYPMKVMDYVEPAEPAAKK
jgi:hypothetical protein